MPINIKDDYTIDIRGQVIASGSHAAERTKRTVVTTLFGTGTLLDKPAGASGVDTVGVGLTGDNGHMVFFSGHLTNNGVGYNSGSVYLYQNDDWNLITTISSSNDIDDDGGTAFGGIDHSSWYQYGAAHMSGSRLLVGASREESRDASDYSGSAYMFVSHSTKGWDNRFRIVDSVTGKSNANYGSGVVLGDTFYAIGSNNADTPPDSGGATEGVVYIYDIEELNGNNHSQILSSSLTSSVVFGRDLEFNKKDRLLIAPDSYTAGYAGVVEIFASSSDINGYGWKKSQVLSGSSFVHPSHEARFGHSVSAFDDYLIVGAPFADPVLVVDGSPTQYAGAGTAWIFKRRAGTYQLEASVSGSEASAQVGFSVSIVSSSLHGVYAAIGAPEVTESGRSNGNVLIYQSQSLGWALSTTLSSSFVTDQSVQHGFGTNCHLTEDLDLGIFANDDGESNVSNAYIYKSSSVINTEVFGADPPMRLSVPGIFNLRSQGLKNPYRTFVGNEKK